MPMSKTIRKNSAHIAWGCLSACLWILTPAYAESDMQLQEKALKARESIRHEGMDHSAHADNGNTNENGGFRGVFYGYLPCSDKDCDGLKWTLSLKPKNNYLLVSQYAKAASREHYEKGKYEWNEKTRTVTLTPNNGTPVKLLSMLDDSALVILTAEGKTQAGNQEPYTLRRSDKAKSREVHIH